MPVTDKFLDRIAARYAGRTLPPPIDPDTQLKHIERVSQNARTTWFGLLGLLAFVGITLLGHSDADFFTRDAATQLPLVGIKVPVTYFFYAAPVLVAAVYAYLHLYLMTLWDALADAPAQVDGQPLSDRVFPWLLSYAALWYRNRRRRDDSAAPGALGLIVVAVSLGLGWLFGIVVMAFLWVRTMPNHDPWVTLWAGGCLWFAYLVGQTGLLTARARMAGATRERVASANVIRRVLGVVLGCVIAAASWEFTRGGLVIHNQVEGYRFLQTAADANAAQNVPPLRPNSGDGPHAANRFHPVLNTLPAQLSEARLTQRPKDWKGFELWLRDLRRDRAKDDDSQKPDETPLIPTREEMQRWVLVISALDAPLLKGRDLNRADMGGSFLPGADLRGAEMQGAYLGGAEMQGANLRAAQMQGANLGSAEMQGADLGWAKMQGANFRAAKMQGAYLGGAEMQGANLRGAEMQGADLGGAKMQGADLRLAEMQGAYLGEAEMQGADLGWAEMQGADLGGAKMQGADLRLAKLTDAENCSTATFLVTVLNSSDVTCDGLNQAQLQLSVGNEDTLLNSPLYVWSCLDPARDDVQANMEKIEAAIQHHPERGVRNGDHIVRHSRDTFRDALFCDKGEIPRKVGRHPKPEQGASE